MVAEERERIVRAAKVVEEITKQVGTQGLEAVIQRFRNGEKTKSDEDLLQKARENSRKEEGDADCRNFEGI